MPDSSVVRLNTKVRRRKLQASACCFIAIILVAAAAQASQSVPHVSAAYELQKSGDLIGAERELQAVVTEARRAGSNSVDLARALAVLGIFYQDVGRFSQAEASFTKCLKIWAEIAGEEDTALAPVITHLGWLYVETGQTGKARQLHMQSWVDRLTVFDPRSKYLPSLLAAIGGLYALEGKLASAEEMYRKDVDTLTERGAVLTMDMASALNNFGFFQLRSGRYREALDHFSGALQLWTRLSGADDLQAAISRLGLAEAYMHIGEYKESGALLQQVLPIFAQKCGPNSLRTADVFTQYARVLRHQKRSNEAKRFEMRARLIRDESDADISYKQVIDLSGLQRDRHNFFGPIR